MGEQFDCPEKAKERKHQHLELANRAQMASGQRRTGFDYEPLFSPHPNTTDKLNQRPIKFLTRQLGAPVWISSMTGGTGKARHINQNLARAAGEFGFGLGLGSCRGLLESRTYWEDFNLRPLIGDGLPFYANLGVAQIERLLQDSSARSRLRSLVQGLDADGLIVHINPLQEWFQPEGDRFERPVLETIERLLGEVDFPIIVKEVGQGLGPRSMRELIKLPLAGIEFGAFGGTNFSLLENMRALDEVSIDGAADLAREREEQTRAGLIAVGHTAIEMVNDARFILQNLGDRARCRDFIVSGGIGDALEGHRLASLLKKEVSVGAVFGQARAFLTHATEDYETLRRYCVALCETLAMAQSYLVVKDEGEH